MCSPTLKKYKNNIFKKVCSHVYEHITVDIIEEFFATYIFCKDFTHKQPHLVASAGTATLIIISFTASS